jgi:hypothetical protein
MRCPNLIFVILAVLGLGSVAQATDLPVPPPPAAVVPPPAPRADCGDKCEYFRNGRDSGHQPAVNGMVCFDFDQTEPGKVELMLYRTYNPQARKGEVIRRLMHDFDTHGSFCVGPAYVADAVAVEICNQAKPKGYSSVRGLPSLRKGRETGKVEMCLLGQACARYIAGS